MRLSVTFCYENYDRLAHASIGGKHFSEEMTSLHYITLHYTV